MLRLSENISQMYLNFVEREQLRIDNVAIKQEHKSNVFELCRA